MLTELRIHEDEVCDDTYDFSKQNMLLSHLNIPSPSCWCILICSHLCWLLPEKLSLLIQILWLLITFESLGGGCHVFW